MKFNKDLILQLRKTENKQQVEDLFKKEGITKLGDKKNYLDWAMYAPSTFFLHSQKQYPKKLSMNLH